MVMRKPRTASLHDSFAFPVGAWLTGAQRGLSKPAVALAGSRDLLRCRAKKIGIAM